MIDESGKVNGIQGMDYLQCTCLFSLFLLEQLAFQDFLRETFDRTYSLLFVYQIQSFNPEFPRCVVHIAPAVQGKRD
jgi:hypothetical protein